MSISDGMDTLIADADASIAAERWFARLQAPDCSAAERMAFLRWRSQPQNAAAYARTEDLWRQLGALEALPQMQGWSQQALQPRRRRVSLPGLAAAALIVAVAVLLSLGLPTAQPPPLLHFAATDQRRTVDLPDRSTVILNVDSVIELAYSDRARVVHLHRGEAIFDVQADPSRPFVVEAGLGEVRALGTRFMVRRQAQATTITHLSGRIAVTTASGTGELLPALGEQLRVGSSGSVDRRQIDPVDVQSWTDGRLVFRATPLVEALGEVNRYAARQVRVVDPTLAQMPISGTVVVGDSRAMARAVAVLLDLNLQANEQGDLLLLPRAP